MMSNAREDRKKLKDRIYCEVNIRPILTLNIVGSIELKSWMVGSIESIRFDPEFMVASGLKVAYF